MRLTSKTSVSPVKPIFAAAAATLLTIALEADIHEHTLQGALLGEWFLPSAGLLGAAASTRLLSPRQNVASISPNSQDTKGLTTRMELQQASNIFVLSLPPCLLANAAVLAAIQATGQQAWQAHTHVLSWAVDWLLVVPGAISIQRAFTSSFAYEDAADWSKAAEWSTTGQVIFRRASSIDSDCEVQVREHRSGWRTLRFVRASSGAESIQSVARLVGPSKCDSLAIANEYLKTMASAALAFLPRADLMDAGSGERHSSILCLGLGGGTLPSFFSCLLPKASMTAVDIDSAVVEASTMYLGVSVDRVRIVTADALEWVYATARDQGPSFDLIFVDVFDGSNETPRAFYGQRFLDALRKLLRADGVVIQNLHTGSQRLDQQVNRAQDAYMEVFGPSSYCNIKAQWQQNLILVGSAHGMSAGDIANDLSKRSREAAAHLGMRSFDPGLRLRTVNGLP